MHSSPAILPARDPRQPEPRRRLAGSFLNVAVGLLAVLAVLAGSATASAELTPGDGPAPPPVSTVGHVFAVGDCIMLGATPDLQQAIGGVEIDAAVSRQASTGIEILRARAAAGQLPDVVVFHLGTNGPVSRYQIDDLMQILSGVRRVVLVNLRVPRPWEESNNALIAAAVQDYANTILVDWHTATATHPDWLWTDGIHLRHAGSRSYAALIASALA